MDGLLHLLTTSATASTAPQGDLLLTGSPWAAVAAAAALACLLGALVLTGATRDDRHARTAAQTQRARAVVAARRESARAVGVVVAVEQADDGVTVTIDGVGEQTRRGRRTVTHGLRTVHIASGRDGLAEQLDIAAATGARVEFDETAAEDGRLEVVRLQVAGQTLLGSDALQ